MVALFLVACKAGEHSEPATSQKEPSKLDELPAPLVADANAKITARQKAVKGWQSVTVPDESAPPCPSAPPPPPATVTGFKMGTYEASKTMSIVSATDLTGAPDPSFPPEVAADLAKMAAIGRGESKIGWSSIDYTDNDYPFQAGPIAKAYQYEVRKMQMGMDGAEKDPTKLMAGLAGSELVLVADKRVRPEVNTAAKTFRPGMLSGVALLWSWDKAAIVCAGRFAVQNEAETFEADRAQVEGMPEEELNLLAYRAGVQALRAMP